MGFCEQKRCTDITYWGKDVGCLTTREGENGKEACIWIALDFTCVFFIMLVCVFTLHCCNKR